MKAIQTLAACAALIWAVQAHASDAATTADAATATALPPAQIADSSMDLEKTMKAMGRHFRALSQASDILSMGEDAQGLLTYASQAEALGLSLSGTEAAKLTEEQKNDYLQGMQTLRAQAQELQQAIAAKDADKAKAQVQAINETRKKGHTRFGV